MPVSFPHFYEASKSLTTLREMKKPHTPFLLRITAGKIPPLIVGLLASITIILILILTFKADAIPLSWNNYSKSSFFIIAFGYMIFITRVIHNSHNRLFKQLLDNTELDTEARKGKYEEFLNQRSLWIETGVAFLVGFGHVYFGIIKEVIAAPSTVKFPYYTGWKGIQVILIWIVITQAISIYMRNMTLMNKLSNHIKIDLLNLQKLMPLTKAGIVSILAFVGVYSILFLVAFTPSELTSNPAFFVLAPTIIIMMYRPLKGVRKRIVKSKEIEIKSIEAAIEGDFDSLKKSRIGNNLKNINVIDLINYKKIIESTFELPVNIPTATRFVFYLIIPLLTWVAASMVDKVIDYLIK